MFFCEETGTVPTEKYAHQPELMAQAHLKECDSGGLFIGENLFHVLAVNSQEEALVRAARRAPLSCFSLSLIDNRALVSRALLALHPAARLSWPACS